MIVSKIYGGLAGQMLQYATGKALALKNNTELYLDTEWFKLPIAALGGTPREFCLDKLNTQYKPYQYNFFSKLKRKVQYPKGLKYIQENKFNEYDSTIPGLEGNIVLDGYWFSFRYFDSIREILLSEFSPRFIDPQNQAIIDNIKSCSNPVSIHVRRGDYVTNPNAKKFHGLIGLEYYRKAIADILTDVPGATFYLFSNDVEWVKENFGFLNNYTLIDFNNDERNHIDIHLMSLCKYNIIANSGFSWWAAYLNQNRDKKVIAPQNWFADQTIRIDDLRPSDWILI